MKPCQTWTRRRLGPRRVAANPSRDVTLLEAVTIRLKVGPGWVLCPPDADAARPGWRVLRLDDGLEQLMLREQLAERYELMADVREPLL